MMDCIDGKVAYDDLSGDGKTWYNGYTAVQKDGFRKTVEKIFLLRMAGDGPMVPDRTESGG